MRQESRVRKAIPSFVSATNSGADVPTRSIQTTFQVQNPHQRGMKFCAFDALVSNANLLHISSECFLSTHSESPFYKPFRTTILNQLHLPPSLRPTVAQASYPHQPWIDCIPLAELRSRVILAASHRPPLLNILDLWYDILSEGLSCSGNPEDFATWKMSDDFAKRWEMLLTMDFGALEAMCIASNPPLFAMNPFDA